MAPANATVRVYPTRGVERLRVAFANRPADQEKIADGRSIAWTRDQASAGVGRRGLNG